MKKSSIILSLLTLTAALATLPALGDLNYLKNGYKYIEKIPVKSITSNFNETKTSNLTDDNSSTEWISFEEPKVQTYPAEYSSYNDFKFNNTNPHSSGIGNSELTFNNGILTYMRYPSDNVANKDSRVLTVNNTIDLVKGVEYQVVTKLSSNKKGEITMQLGDQMATAMVSGIGEEEVVFKFEPFTESQEGAVCKLDAIFYTGELKLVDAKLIAPKPIASTYSGNWKVLDIIDGVPIVDEGNLVAEQARHFKIIDGLSIDKTHSYRLTTRIKVDGPNDYKSGGRVIVNFGTWGNGNTYNENSKYLNLTDEWDEYSVEFIPNLEDPDNSILKDATQDWASIYCWDNNGPKACKSNILVDWVEVYDITTNTVVKKEDYSSKTEMSDWNKVPNPTVKDDAGADNGKVLYSGCPAFHYRVLSGLSLDPTQTYTVKIKINGTRNPSETVYVNLGSYGNGKSNGKTIAVTPNMTEYTLTFNPGVIPNSPTGFCSIYCPDVNGKITVESVELFGGTQETQLNFSNNNLEEVKDYGSWNESNYAQFSIQRGLDLEPNQAYLVTVKAKSSTSTDIQIVIGSDTKPESGGDGWSAYGKQKINFAPEWIETKIFFPKSDLTNIVKIEEVRLQPLGYVGKIEIEQVTIYPVADTGIAAHSAGDQTKELASELNDASIGGAGYTIPSVNGNTLSSASVPVTQKFYVFKDMELPGGTYNMEVVSSAETAGKVKVYFGSPDDLKYSSFDITRNLDDSHSLGIGTLNVPEGKTIIGDLIFELEGSNGGFYNGSFDLKSVHITNGQVSIIDSWNYEGASEYTYYVAQEYKPYLHDDELSFEHGWKRIRLMDNLTMKKGNRYKLITRLKGSVAGNIQISLGGVPLRNVAVSEDYTEWTGTFDFTDTKPINQYCEIIRPSDYQGTLYVDYVGFEETFNSGKVFNEEGHDKLFDFMAKSELKDGELVVEPKDGDYEVVLISGATDLKAETSYGVTARVVYSGTPTFKIQYGGLSKKISKDAVVRTISSKDGLTEAELRVVFTKEELKATDPDGSYVVLQVYGHSENAVLRLKSAKMWNPTEEFHGDAKKVTDWNNYQAGRLPKIEIAGEELIASIDPLVGQWESTVGFILRSGINLKPGKKYSLYAEMKCSQPDQEVIVRLGGWGESDRKTCMVNSNDWKEYEFHFDPISETNAMVRFYIDQAFKGILEVKKIRVECDESENVVDFSTLSANPNPEVEGSFYPAPEVAWKNYGGDNNAKRLLATSCYKPFKVTKELKFNPRYNYTVKANVTVEKGGQLKVSLANDSFSESMTTQTINANTPTEINLGPFPSVTASEGFLVFQGLSDLGNVQVSNVEITYALPDAAGQPLASDYFDVELGTPLAKEGLYSFHIGYSVDADNEPMPETPTRFIVQGKKSGEGDDKFVNIGQYTITPNTTDANSRGHMFIETYDAPLSVKENNTIETLRFICTDNYGHSTGIVQDGEAYAIGSKIRMTRFAVYKQSEFLTNDDAKNNNWVVPLLTRFQIEAMGQKYAYPGPRLRDMIDVAKNYNLSGKLFDGDQSNGNPYWDTTVPYNKEAGVAAEGAQNRDYDEDGIDSSEDYIDILLPQLNSVVKKYNGVAIASEDTRGKNQVVIVLQRGNDGTISKDDDLRVLDLPSGDPFLNKSNGFPLEIRYRGIKKNANSISEIAANNVDDGVDVMRFPVIASDDSIRFALDVKEGWDGIRLYCRENTGNLERKFGEKTVTHNYGDIKGRYLEEIKNIKTTPGTRILRFAKIRAYMEIPKINLESEKGRQDYDMLYNHREDLEDYGWTHTQGIIDKINNPPFGGEKNYMLYGETEAGEEKTWKDVIDKYYKFFDQQGLAYPDFSYLNNPFDDEDIVPSNGARRTFSDYEWNPGSINKNYGPRQRTYTVLHEVYALPGERVDLYPYSDIWNNFTGYNYEDQFVRWYDYLTDKVPNYLYFFAEPKSAIKTERGFIGGRTLLDYGYRGKGSVASVYFPTSSINDDWSYEDGGITRMKDQWIAADFSLTFNTNLAERLGKNVTTWESGDKNITEPIVTFRHIFHIQSASVFADKNMGDYEGNKKYVNSKRRYISTFADKSFKIRLEQSMPLDADTKSSFYYKETVDNKIDYKRVRGYEIMTYYLENNDADKLYVESNYELTGDRSSDINILKNKSIYRSVNGEEQRMFEPDDQPFMHIDSYVETTTDSKNWLRDNKEFARSIQCRKNDALKGKYLVRIYGKDSEDQIIRLRDKDGKFWPLVIAEYELEFLDDTRASFVPDEDITEINANPSHKYYSHMERYLERRFGATSTAKAVNFDQYTILKKKDVEITDENGITSTVNFARFGFFESNEKNNSGLIGSRLKLPITWANSNYGFGYTTTGDYNMFRLADHSNMTPYKEAANARQDNPFDVELGKTQKGTYDRLFYNTGGKEKGLFYYVNAASDPGEMVKIDFDYLCPGSTIYVSAWVNEFNSGQPETANVIFNFYGNIAKTAGSSSQDNTNTKAEDNTTSTGDAKIIRTEQLHGFATGYVKRNPEDDYENGGNTGGDQGKWMHVYYSFVPDKSHADLEEDEEIVSYTLVLENNCVSSAGADYAIDDIRAYVVSPRVEAEQKGALCEKDDKNIDIEVRIPFEALKQSVIANMDNNNNGVVKLQYSIIDKTKYDDKLEELRAQRTNEGKDLQSDDYYDAFATGVLHYPHDNNESLDLQVKNKPLSWGTIDFYPNYENQKDEIKDKITVDGKEMTVYDFMIGKEYADGSVHDGHIITIDEEQYFTFITHPVSHEGESYNEFDKAHRNYYVIVDHLGTDGLFTDVGASYGTNETNADVYPSLADKDNWPKYDAVLANAFQICTDCARMAEFTLKSAAQIVIDGVLHEDGENITCCENQRPVIQLNLKTKKEDLNGNVLSDDYSVVDKNGNSENPYLDWWTGEFESFASTQKTIDGTKTDLWDVLDYFRTDYPDADTWKVPTVEERKDGETKPEKFTNEMRNWLKELCATTKVNDKGETVPVEPKLILHQSSYVFPQSKTKLGKDEDWKDIYVTAIPKATPTEIPGEDGNVYVICTQPREVKITVSNTSPTLFNGFLDITYPETVEDVPLRAGLKQLENVSDGTLTNELYVPLRNMKPATDDVTSFLSIKEERDDEDNEKITREADEFVYLVETNDPAYRQLSDYVPDPNRKDDEYDVETRIAGKVQNLSVSFSKVGDTYRANATPMARVVFYKEKAPAASDSNKLPMGITFREGYYYKFKFNYEEASSPSMEAAGYEEKCMGQTIFSIKVVPEYQEWTGGASLNWNNDDNWRRVDSKKDLLGAGADKLYEQDGTDRFTTDGGNKNTHSYAPLNFTKVIIPAGTSYPMLAAKEHQLYSDNNSSVNVDNGNGSGKIAYTWTSNAPKATPIENMTIADKYNIGDYKEDSKTQPTVYINYDMSAVTYTGLNNNVYCRPWYANACEQIHFNSNAEILNQQYLDYEKAWVDMEMLPHRWYNVASPLYGVVAGDMYLPSVGTDTVGRQVTELFKPISFDDKLNNRFAPAVYQRGWDKGNETVYLLPRDNNSEGHNAVGTPTETVALASTWSHVYNDVKEAYSPGTGYSVKTDVTRLENFSIKDDEETAEQSYVKFRFPKADTFFDYYDDGKPNDPGRENGNSIDRSKAGKLFEMTGTEQTVNLKKANDGNLFLVGNPFMAHLDMAKFLEANAGAIEPKYWILSEGEGQVGVVMAHEKDGEMLSNETLKSGTIEASSNTTGQLPPMQGFFVQAKTSVKELQIKFTPYMMAVQPYSDAANAPILKAPAVGAVDEDIIRVSTPESTAIIRLTPAAEKGYAASEDVEMIDDSNQRGIRRIYTVAGTMASAINQTPDADGVEVGLLAPTDSVTVATFNGIALEDYMLYDTATGEMTQLYDGFELEMTGSVIGRYFLTSGVDTAEIEDGAIRIMPGVHEVVVTAPAVCGRLTVRVFDTLGREVAKAEEFDLEARVALDPGIYVVEAVGSESGRKSTKISIR